MHENVSDAEIAQANRETGWTANRIRVVGHLFNNGMSASECARLIGGVTRNAVIGIIHRRNLTSNERKLPSGSNGKAKGVSQTGRRRIRIRSLLGRQGDVIIDDVIPRNVDDATISLEQRRSLFDLNAGCCHWPVGDPTQPDFFFCGAVVRKIDGLQPQPYCPSHMHRAHDGSGRRSKTKDDILPKLSRAKVNNDFRR